MFFKLVLLFTLVPALEIYILIRVGALIGPLNTLLTIVLTGILGAYYARQQGFRIIRRIRQKLEEGDLPGNELINGFMLLIGGALLLTPGFLTDLLGLSSIFPPTRDVLKNVVKAYLNRKIKQGEIRAHKGPFMS
jgi:UPF0716 protein FxsA